MEVMSPIIDLFWALFDDPLPSAIPTNQSDTLRNKHSQQLLFSHLPLYHQEVHEILDVR